MSRSNSRALRACVSSVIETMEPRRLLATASPNSFDFSTGLTGNGVKLNFANYVGEDLKITLGTGDSRSAFYASAVPAQAFTTHFTVRFASGSAGGMTFAIQNEGPTARGSGKGLGYWGIGTSAAISFDAANNVTGLFTNGANPVPASSTSLSGSGITLGSGNAIDVAITYAGTTLTVTETDRVAGNSATQTYNNVNLPALLGGSTGYVGFTGAAGTTAPASTSTFIADWSYSDTTAKANGGMNLSWPSTVFTDLMKISTWSSYNSTSLLASSSLDAVGWPTVDADLELGGDSGGAYYGKLVTGKYTVTFNGQAAVSATVGSVTQSYDTASNTTTAIWTLQDGQLPNITSPRLQFKDTRRTVTSAINTGITNVKVMLPSARGANTSFNAAQVFHPGLLAEIQNNGMKTVRYMAATGSVRSVVSDWSDRTLPTYATQLKKFDSDGTALDSDNSLGNGLAWEYVVALSNATDTDPWINIPYLATPDYITKLAKLFRYGADANGLPYDSVQANPVWPPLEAGRKVYVEYANEVWNSGFDETYANINRAAAATTAFLSGAQTPQAAVGAMINYDHIATTLSNGKYNNQTVLDDRLMALNIKNASDLFRSVWGNENMGSVIRPVYAWRHSGDNAGYDGNGIDGLTFLNNYFNNADVPAGGTPHVIDPHPANYFIWGGGGAFYTQTVNPDGNDGVLQTANLNFEGSGSWTLSNASIESNGSMGSLVAPEGTRAVAISSSGYARQTMQFPTRIAAPGATTPVQNTQLFSFRLAASANAVGTLSLWIGSRKVWSTSTFSTTGFARQSVAVDFNSLNLSSAFQAVKFSFDPNTAGVGTGTVYVDNITAAPLGNGSFEDGLDAGNAAGQEPWVTSGNVFLSAGGQNGNPNTNANTHAVTLASGGSISQSMFFNGDNFSDVSFDYTLARKNATGTNIARGNLELFIDNVPAGLFISNGYTLSLLKSGVTRSDGTLDQAKAKNFSSAFSAPLAGLSGWHTVKLVYTDGDANNPGYAFMDNVQVDSIASMFSASVKSTNSAKIQPATDVQGDSRIAHLFGLHSVAYEGGLTLGADKQSPLQNKAELDPRVVEPTQTLMNNYYSYGGELPVYFQSSGANHGLVTSYYDVNLSSSGGAPKLATVGGIFSNTQVAIDSQTQQTDPLYNPASSPGTLTFTGTGRTIYRNPTSQVTSAASPDAKTYYFRVDSSGYYSINASLDPSAVITANLSLDGDVLGSITAGSPAGPFEPVWLTAGLHGVKILNTSETASGLVNSISVLPA